MNITKSSIDKCEGILLNGNVTTDYTHSLIFLLVGKNGQDYSIPVPK